MEFGSVAIADAHGAVLAHSVQAGQARLRKGRFLTAEDIAVLQAAGVASVTVARLGLDDVHEDAAAARVAAALVPNPQAACLEVTAPFTGRVNLLANGPGVAVLDTAALEALNRLDPMLTCATVPPFARMTQGGMVATIKIISYAVPEAAVVEAEAIAQNAISLAPVALKNASLIMTSTGAEPGADKAVKVIAARLAALGMELHETVHVAHDAAAIAGAIEAVTGQMILLLTASATSDSRDVAPEGLRLAGGQMTRFGMPVDPGNLLFFGQRVGVPVIGLPGCARSPALNGADWVLERIACGVPVTDESIAAMGVGGLLKEIPTRPQPRSGK